MEIQGTFKQKLPLESGESKSGKAWQKQSIIVKLAKWDNGKEDMKII
jgi:hypothetical protein